MATMTKLLDAVALMVDLPEANLQRRQVGTVVAILGGVTALEVEFSDCNAHTYSSVALRLDQIMVLCYEPVTVQPISGGAQK